MLLFRELFFKMPQPFQVSLEWPKIAPGDVQVGNEEKFPLRKSSQAMELPR